MASTPACRRDGSHIGIQLFGEVLESSVVGCANDGGQLVMQKCECGCGWHHVCCVVGRHSNSEAWMLMLQKLVHAGTRKLLKMGIFQKMLQRLVSSIDKNRVAKSELTKLWAIFGLHIWSGWLASCRDLIGNWWLGNLHPGCQISIGRSQDLGLKMVGHIIWDYNGRSWYLGLKRVGHILVTWV